LEVATVPEGTEESTEEIEDPSSEPKPNVKKMNKKELKQYSKDKMQEKLDQVKEIANPANMLAQGIEELDERFELPDILRPYSKQGIPGFAAVRANDPVYPQTPRFDAQKEFTDLNGGNLEK